jgi:hypothetical protein
MGFQLDFDTTNKIMRISLDGILTDEALLDGFTTLTTCNTSYGPTCCIIDYTGVKQITLSNEGLRSLAKKPPALQVECLQVNVAPRELMFGLARLFQALACETRPNLRVVRSQEEALSLIGVKSPTFSPICVSLPKSA